jgi:hypothetical protein
MQANVSRIALIAALTGGVGGCGSRQYDVTGKVTYNGAPLDKPDGQIVFVGPARQQVAAPIGPDGTYHAAGVWAGENKVVVYWPNPKVVQRKSLPKRKSGEEPPPPESPFLTPDKYGTVDTTDLSVTVEKETEFNANLVGPRIR